jgi:hypothetical protein
MKQRASKAGFVPPIVTVGCHRITRHLVPEDRTLRDYTLFGRTPLMRHRPITRPVHTKDNKNTEKKNKGKLLYS